MVDQALADAEGTASQAQIAILERAKVADEVTFADAQEAVRNTFACMEQVDVQGSFLPPDTSQGYPTVAYKYGTDVTRPESEWLPVAEECIKRESTIVEWLYQNQPAVESLKDEYYRTVHRPRIVACLAEHEVDVPQDATRADIDLLVEELYNESSGTVWVDNGDGSKSGYQQTPEQAVQCYLDTL